LYIHHYSMCHTWTYLKCDYFVSNQSPCRESRHIEKPNSNRWSLYLAKLVETLYTRF
jgi:hypothetical protein